MKNAVRVPWALRLSYGCALESHRQMLAQILEVPGHKAQAHGRPTDARYGSIHDTHSSAQYQNADTSGPREVGGNDTHSQHCRDHYGEPS